jgi:uncharacterized protein (TIGR03437 family)
MKTFQTVFALLLASGAASAQPQYVISTPVGIPGVQAYFGDGGAATSAQFYKPTLVTLDSKGNIYIVDYYAFAVRMVTAGTGNIITISGNGNYGWVDGLEKTSAGDGTTVLNAGVSEIGYVKGLAVDSSGNVYLGDSSNCRIRKVDTSQNTTTIAGNGTCGYAGDGGAATAAQLNYPAGVAVDKSGNIYETEYLSSVVRKIDTSGKISTIAGTGTWGNTGDGGAATKATLESPLSIAIDSSGNIFIGDTGTNSIREITTDGNIRTVAKNVSADSLAVDASGNLYFTDGVSPVVQEILASGSVITIAGNGTSGYGGDVGQSTLAQLDHPQGVSVTANGTVYIADTNNHIIRQLTPVPFSVGAINNAASGVGGAVAPGEIVAVFGNGLGPATLTSFKVANGSIGSTIPGGAQIFFGASPAPLIYTSSGLAAAIVPYSVAGQSTANVALLLNGTTSVTTVVPVAAAAPGIFTSNTTGSGQAAAVNVATGAVNSAANPVRLGAYISLYITGAGQTTPAASDGQIISSTALSVLPVTVTIGGIAAPVTYAGAAPTQVAGLTQVNVQVPQGVAVGSAVPVTVSVNGVPAQAGVTISVSN